MPYLGRLAGPPQWTVCGVVHVLVHGVHLHHTHDRHGHRLLAGSLLLYLHVRLQAHLLPLHEHTGRHRCRG